MQNVSNPSELTLTFDKFFTESALISKHVISDLLSSGHFSTLKDSDVEFIGYEKWNALEMGKFNAQSVKVHSPPVGAPKLGQDTYGQLTRQMERLHVSKLESLPEPECHEAPIRLRSSSPITQRTDRKVLNDDVENRLRRQDRRDVGLSEDK